MSEDKKNEIENADRDDELTPDDLDEASGGVRFSRFRHVRISRISRPEAVARDVSKQVGNIESKVMDFSSASYSTVMCPW